ncbi:Dol-P-Man:Man(5)GlcNAc(2)-PP-Dol alpha-1,3-mannosyltransferase [Cytospora mali]|uniref:Dol-P-Man:Man(5)GlcNAc(2)-PP-Dol alpha-1,3-mannosyltransferase n=1 Tax=Cytospora mali TaxID=578113 RepID=A0A194VQK4_CYTMA|nr:Dol-P-Man:Man(5)GlcNAc(2)-PP-Dol alpha-1,3-mannosyltransferase [Valsa mali]
MSKSSSRLSPTLKELINAPFAHPGPAKAPAGIGKIYERIASQAHSNKVGPRPWLALSTAATFTLNSPDSLTTLHATASNPSAQSYKPMAPVPAAELIREVGLKCISFNGIPRSINCLGAFHSSLPPDIQSGLETKSSRTLTPSNLARRNSDGLALWSSVYDPFDTKLINKLALSHPDLPVHILGSHYGPLLADPQGEDVDRGGLASVGRVLTSVVAIACLRAQTGVGPQVLSHVFGLRKAIEQGVHLQEAESVEEREGMQWLAGDEGSEWILRSVDGIVEAVGGGNFAAKL